MPLPRMLWRATELWRGIEVERGDAENLNVSDVIAPTLDLLDVKLFGPIQSTGQVIAHGPVPAVVGQFSAAQIVAGRAGLWVSDIISLHSGALDIQFQFSRVALANLTLAFVEQEDLAAFDSPGTVLNDFGPAQLGAANTLARGSFVENGSLAAAITSGILIPANFQTTFLRTPVYVPPNRAIIISGVTANTAFHYSARLVEPFRFFGRESGDR